ncbi:MAG TPA: SRPBCC family protein [Candidatus Krumholzibacteria bacterium]
MKPELDSMGTIERTPRGALVRFEREFDVPVTVLWHALTDPLGMASWLADASIDLRVGGSVEIRFGDAPVRGTITELAHNQVLAYSWHESRDDESHVRFELVSDGGRSRLTVIHTRLAPESGTGFAAGWHHHLELLADLLSGTPRDWSPERFGELLARY